MRFLNKWYVAATAIIIAYFLLTSGRHMLCWDGTGVNETLLNNVCGVTEQEFWNKTAANESFCPRAWDSGAIYMVGGCDIQWDEIATSAAITLAAFNVAYAVLYFAMRPKGKARKTSKR